MFEVMEMLSTHGHHVVPFSMDFERNHPSPYSKHFAASPMGRDQAYFAEKSLGAAQRVRMLTKALYNFEAREKVTTLIREERIDLVYTIQVVNYLYPAIVDAAHSVGVPVVCRSSDYQLLCPAYHFFRDGKVCEDCKGGLYNALKGACLQGSRAVTGVRILSMYFQGLIGTREKVSGFVAPSKFLRDKLVEYGYLAGKVHWVPTFIDTSQIVPEFAVGGYALYVGNIREHKGIHSLILAMRGFDKVNLKIAGISTGPEANSLEEMIAREGITGVEFLGFVDKDALSDLYRGAAFLVMPSLWYENTPNVVLEAMAHGKPVVGSQIGSMPELVRDGVTGLTFRPGDPGDLRKKMESMIFNKDFTSRMGREARKLVESEYSVARHYDALMEIFERAVGASREKAFRKRTKKD